MTPDQTMRGRISAALNDPLFIAFAAEQTGAFLRQAIAMRLNAQGVDVVVVSATGIGEERPYAGAEVVWQPKLGGEFEHQVISWTPESGDGVAIASPSGARHVLVDCPACGSRNELAFDQGASLASAVCSHCTAPLDIVDATIRGNAAG